MSLNLCLNNCLASLNHCHIVIYFRKPRIVVYGHKLDKISCKKSLLKKYPCKTRTGMSCAVDTAWQKRGFDSLTCKYKDLIFVNSN